METEEAAGSQKQAGRDGCGNKEEGAVGHILELDSLTWQCSVCGWQTHIPALPRPLLPKLPNPLENWLHLPPPLPPAHLLSHIRQCPRPLLCSERALLKVTEVLPWPLPHRI